MGRGRSSAEFEQAFQMVASRQGQVRGTEIEALGSIELDGDEQVALRELVDAEREHPGKPGFDSAVLDATDDLLAALVSQGLAEQLDGTWRATTAGVQLIGAFASADWSVAGSAE